MYMLLIRFKIQEVKSDKCEKKLGKPTITAGNFNIPLSVNNSRQRISKDIEELNNIINQLNLTDIYWTFHPTSAEYIFFSSVHETWKIHHILGYKNNLKKIKK